MPDELDRTVLEFAGAMPEKRELRHPTLGDDIEAARERLTAMRGVIICRPGSVDMIRAALEAVGVMGLSYSGTSDPSPHS